MPTKTLAPTKGVRVLRVKLENIHVDEKYQRPLSERFVQKIVDNYDEKMLGVLVLNQRPYEADSDDDYFAIVDGQHRLEALKRMGRKYAEAVVFVMDVKDEGTLFTSLQKERRAASAIDQHKALLFSKDELAVRIERIANNNGYKIASDSIACVTAIRLAGTPKSNDNTGGHNWNLSNFDKALKVVSKVWPNDNSALKREVIMGMWMLFERGHLKVTVDNAYEAFLDLDPRTVVRDAKIARSELQLGTHSAAGWVLADAFNKYHRLRGTNRIEQRLFTPSFRSTLGRRTQLKGTGVDTSAGATNKFETRDPLTAGDSE